MTLAWPTRHTLLSAAGNPDPPSDPDDPPPVTGTWTDGVTRHGARAAQLFSPTCYINVPLPSNASVDTTNGPAVIASMVSQAQLNLKPNLGTTKYSARIVRVPADQPRVPVLVQRGATLPNYMVAMYEICLDPGMPIPDDYVPQGDSDDEFIVYCPETNLAQEYWRLRPIDPATNNGIKWTCQSMWNITGLSTHPGRSRNSLQGATYPHAPTTAAKRMVYEDKNMSVSATRIPFLGTMLTEEDVIRGQVDHALNLSIPYSPPSPNYVWPASSTDGYVASSPVKQGMRFRFPPGYVVPTGLHPVAQIVSQGVRDYGMFVMDKSGSMEIDAEPKVHDYFNGTAPSSVLDGFEWDQLQLLVPGSDANPNPTS